MDILFEKVRAELIRRLEPMLHQKAAKFSSFLLILAFALIYFLAAKLGLRLATVHPSSTPVWPGTGLALAAVLLFGDSVWLGIFLGAFFVNLTTAGSILSSFGIATGNTLEALFGAYLVNRFANGRNALNRAEGIFKFALFAGFVATTVAATFGTVSLFVTGFLQGADPKSVWFTWWLGDMVGALLVTPCFLLWSFRHEVSRARSRFPWWAASLACLMLIAWFTFGGSFLTGGPDFPLKFVCIPFVVWAAVELRRHELPLALVAFAAIAMEGTLAASVRPVPNESLLLMQIFFGIVVITGLVTSAAVSERNRHEDELREARADLELRVQERTRELKIRIEQQKLTEQALQDLSARLLQVQDEERRRVARDLHDSTGQTLAALTISLSQLAKKIATVAPETATKFDQATELARSVLDEIRTTSYLLHPPLLDETGLKSALTWYAQGFQERSKIQVLLEIPEELARLSPQVEIMLFRIVQECLTNVLRHSSSQTVTVRLLQSAASLTLDVEDQGSGIEPEKLKAITELRTTGVGLRGMRERLSSVDGELKITSDETGTLVRCVVPLARSASLADRTPPEQQPTAP